MMPQFVRRPVPERDGADPGLRKCGYYRVRDGRSWRVARWMPQARRWEIGASNTRPARHWDEIAERVA